MDASSEKARQFKAAFVDLVTQFGLAKSYGLAQIRQTPALPTGYVFLETEELDRTLRVRLVPRDNVLGGVQSVWRVQADANGSSHFVAIQPCVHAGVDASNAMHPDDAAGTAREAFARAFRELVLAHGVDDGFALARVHRHFDMTDDEVLVESSAAADELRIQVVPRSSIQGEEPIQWRVDDSWDS